MQWPDRLRPDQAPVYARNEMLIPAEQTVVWQWICRAELWPRWYPNCRWLKFERGSGPDLHLDTQFRWWTFGAVVDSTVRVFNPQRSIEWDGFALLGTQVYHGWWLASAGQCTRVVTEETQTGPLPWVARWPLRSMLWLGHQLWLSRLRQVSRTGPPPLPPRATRASRRRVLRRST